MNVPAFTDTKTGKPSYTLTMFVIGFFVINVKLLFSGVQITEHIKFDSFTGVDYSAAIAAIGGIYSYRKNNTIKPDAPEEPK